MRPTKNRIFCPKCHFSKMLFETKQKAENFIKYNTKEILEENGTAPVRAYYCPSCGGYHVTSSEEEYMSKIKNFISMAKDAEEAYDYVTAARLTWYAREILENRMTHYMPSFEDVRLEKATWSTINNLTRKYFENKNTAKRTKDYYSFLHFSSLNFQGKTLDLIDEFKDEGTGNAIFEVRPQLFAHINGKYYYILCWGSSTNAELKAAEEMNILEEGESIVSLKRHILNIVQVARTKKQMGKRQSFSIKQYLKTTVLWCGCWGKKLQVLTRGGGWPRYLIPQNASYWIRFGNKNVHFYLGKCLNYCCLMSEHEIDPSRTFCIQRRYKKVD